MRTSPLPSFRLAFVCTARLTSFAPARQGAPDKVRSVEPLGDDPAAARLVFADGRRRAGALCPRTRFGNPLR